MDHSSPAAKAGDPKFSDIVFSLLIIYIWGLNKDIQGAVEVSPLSNSDYSRWPPWSRKSPENASVMITGNWDVSMR